MRLLQAVPQAHRPMPSPKAAAAPVSELACSPPAMHGSERTFPLLESAICGITRAQNCVVGSFQNVVAMGVPAGGGRKWQSERQASLL